MSEEEKRQAMVPEIDEARRKLRELESKFRKIGRVKYHHKCPHCKVEWEGTKEIIKECTYCKGRIHMVTAVAKKDAGSLQENAAKFDAYLKEHGSYTKVEPGYGRKEGRKTIFTAKPEGFEYARFMDGVEEDRKIVGSTEEIIKDWFWWDWLKGVTLPKD